MRKYSKKLDRTIKDDKTVQAARGYLIAQTNAHTREMEQLLPKVRAAIESSNYPEARQLILEVIDSGRIVTETLQHVANATGASLYAKEDLAFEEEDECAKVKCHNDEGVY